MGSDSPQADKLPDLKRYKAKLVRLHAIPTNKMLLENKPQEKIEEEEPALFHILKMLSKDVRHA
jgi:hypothetical protein